jgi:hypothetical protein
MEVTTVAPSSLRFSEAAMVGASDGGLPIVVTSRLRVAGRCANSRDYLDAWKEIE